MIDRDKGNASHENERNDNWRISNDGFVSHGTSSILGAANAVGGASLDTRNTPLSVTLCDRFELRLPSVGQAPEPAWNRLPFAVARDDLGFPTSPGNPLHWLVRSPAKNSHQCFAE